MAAELGGDTRGIVDLSEPELVADALADVGAVDHVVLAAIARDTNTLDDYDIASARYLVTMKLLGTPRPQRAARPAGGGRLDRAVRWTGQGPSLPRRDDGRYRQRRHLRHDARAGRAAGTSPGECDPSGHCCRQLHTGRAARVHRKVRRATPTGRNVTMEDIVDGVDFLIRNRSVNGIDLYVDGGWLLQ